MAAMHIRTGLVLLSVLVSGCTTSGGGAGFLGGSSTPPSAEENVSAAIVKSLNGGLIGGQIGAGLNDQDRRAALAAEYRALEYTPANQPVPWSASSGRTGQVVALQPYRVGSQDCRQYTQTVNGTAAPARGTACRNADGSWSLLN